jgi:hypothetical protein
MSVFAMSIGSPHGQEFASFQALHAKTCTIVGTNCELDINYFSAFFWFLLPALLLFLYARLGFAARIAHWAERRTGKIWLQALIVAFPFVVCFIVPQMLQKLIVLFDDPLKLCNAFITSHVGSPNKQCLGGNPTFLSVIKNAIVSNLWLILPISLALYAGYWTFRKAPRLIWVLPFLCFSLFALYTALGFQHTTNPISSSNNLMVAIAPLAKQEGWPLDRVQALKEDFGTRSENGLVISLGWNKSIVFGDAFVQEYDEYAAERTLTKFQQNGFYRSNYSPGALRAIMGHELAHVQRWHVEILLIINLVLGAFLLWGAARFVFGKHNSNKAIWVLFPLYASALMVVYLAQSSIIKGFQLITEYDADHVGLDISKEPDGFAEWALASAAGSPLELPFKARWLLTWHPSNGERIRMAIAWQKKNRPQQPIAIPDPKKLYTPANNNQK